MNKTVLVGTDSLLFAAKRLLSRGEISLQDYRTMKCRNELLSKSVRDTKIILR